MKALVEPLEGNKVKLSIEVDEQEFEKNIDAAFKKIAREVRVPGFRPGKAPRRILEARLGKEAGRTEAIRDSLPEYYTQAVREHEVDVIAAPQIDIKGGEESGPISFEAVVETRPQIHVPGYEGLKVEIPSPEATEEDIESQIDRLRGNFGELVVAERPATKGDFVTIDISGTRDGEDVAGLSADDFVYELGSGSVLPELDTNLEGAKVGDILAFESAEAPGGAAQLKVLVKEVKEKRLPDLTDEWASDASEFDTVEELRADIAKRTAMVKKLQASMALRNAALDALVELVTEEPPMALVDAEVERQVHELGHRLEQQGATINDYLQAIGQEPQDFLAQMREQYTPSVKADLALRAVAEAEGIEPTDEDIDAEIERLAEAYKVKPDRLRRDLERSDQMPAVRSDWKKSRALEWLVEHVEIVDPDGNTIDRAALEPDTEPDTADGDIETVDPDSDPNPVDPAEDAPEGTEGPVDSADDPEESGDQ